MESNLKKVNGNLIGIRTQGQSKEDFKLTTTNNPTIIQGLLSIEDKQDHIFIPLIEQLLHATHFCGQRMFIETSAALRLISQYFKN